VPELNGPAWLKQNQQEPSGDGKTRTSGIGHGHTRNANNRTRNGVGDQTKIISRWVEFLPRNVHSARVNRTDHGVIQPRLGDLEPAGSRKNQGEGESNQLRKCSIDEFGRAS